ncbi:MAG: hypothetical protein KUL78_02735 [Flavobacterium sp.]|jgi:hypothetical protein|nr:hypothetical protein [Flavobacterium sp.]
MIQFQKKIKGINVKNGNSEFSDSFMMLQRPVFNKKRSKVLLRVDYVYSGEEFLLTKKIILGKRKKLGVG